jgi:hypothetical protein
MWESAQPTLARLLTGSGLFVKVERSSWLPPLSGCA